MIPVSDLPVHVAPPEYVVLRKLAFYREGGSEKHPAAACGEPRGLRHQTRGGQRLSGPAGSPPARAARLDVARPSRRPVRQDSRRAGSDRKLRSRERRRADRAISRHGGVVRRPPRGCWQALLSRAALRDAAWDQRALGDWEAVLAGAEDHRKVAHGLNFYEARRSFRALAATRRLLPETVGCAPRSDIAPRARRPERVSPTALAWASIA